MAISPAIACSSGLAGTAAKLAGNLQLEAQFAREEDYLRNLLKRKA
jgi:hypothetical protein